MAMVNAKQIKRAIEVFIRRYNRIPTAQELIKFRKDGKI